LENLSVDNDENENNAMRLPPIGQALPIIEFFLENFNSVLPLFHAETFLRQVIECYSHPPQQRDSIIWAAINMVLALCSQQVLADNADLNHRPEIDNIAEYFDKAQSVISSVMLGDLRLINIQTLLGMVMMLQSAQDLTPSLILISAAMRLAHRMGLHDRAASAHLDPVERRQHARVFWLAYILERDISLRSQQPSIQLDDDIDLELPEGTLVDTNITDRAVGFVTTRDGSASLNYFLARVQLANIQGALYNCLYSTRAMRLSASERSVAKQSIVGAIEEWRATVPAEFGAEVVLSTTSNSRTNAAFFCVLHAASLRCMLLIDGSHAMDEKWVSSLREHGRGTHTLQLPPSWEALVSQARSFMMLCTKAWSKDAWFRW
jgi:hypothetical protein